MVHTQLKYSFIIPTVANRDSIFGIIDFLKKVNSNLCEIIVVIQSSSKNDPAILKKIENTESIVHLINYGIDSVPMKRNLGAKASTGEVICFIDDDVSLDYSMLKFLNEGHLSKGTIYFPEIRNSIFLPYPLGDHVGGKSFVSACFVMFRDDFFRNGPMDDRLLTYRDDSEFFIRAVRNGFKLKFIQDTFVWHPVRFTKLRTIKSIFLKNISEPLFHRLTHGEYYSVLEPGRISFTANRHGFSILSYSLAISISVMLFLLFEDPIILFTFIIIYCVYSVIPTFVYFYYPEFFLRSRFRKKIISLSIYLVLILVLIPSRIIGSVKHRHFTL